MMLPCCSRHKTHILYGKKLQQGLVVGLLQLVAACCSKATRTDKENNK